MFHVSSLPTELSTYPWPSIHVRPFEIHSQYIVYLSSLWLPWKALIKLYIPKHFLWLHEFSHVHVLKYTPFPHIPTYKSLISLFQSPSYLPFLLLSKPHQTGCNLFLRIEWAQMISKSGHNWKKKGGWHAQFKPCGI